MITGHLTQPDRQTLDRILDRRHHQPAHGHRADLVPDVLPPARHRRDAGPRSGPRALGKPFKGQFGPKEQKLRWSNFKNLGADADAEGRPGRGLPALPHARRQRVDLRRVHDRRPAFIQKPSLLVSAVNMIDDLPLTGATPRATSTSTCSAS